MGSGDDKCGVFGVIGTALNVAMHTKLGLTALQHRGQESAGLAVGDGRNVNVLRDMGLVLEVLNRNAIRGMTGDVAIGQCRYSTSGDSNLDLAQPRYDADIAIGHNGDITNTAELARMLGRTEPWVSDTDAALELVKRSYLQRPDGPGRLAAAVTEIAPLLEGAYSLVVMDRNELVVLRDPNGFRPLHIGRIETADGGRGWATASETGALDHAGARDPKEVEPGQLLAFSRDGFVPHRPYPDERVHDKHCFFEYVYLARPDQIIKDMQVAKVRYGLGQLLSKVEPLSPSPHLETVVAEIPNSGTLAAHGYASASGFSKEVAFVTTDGSKRSFMDPNARGRSSLVGGKLNALAQLVKGKRVILVDDTIVRGNTPMVAIQKMRDAGAVEVHLRISAPPYLWPCHYGVNIKSRQELFAVNTDGGRPVLRSIEAMTEMLGADSLAFLPIDMVRQVIGNDVGVCDACVTGDFPLPVEGAPETYVAEGLGTKKGRMVNLGMPTFALR